ncbi:MAG: hypothetical protein ACI8UO_004397 [Verrucomicrobiales bacterium]
MLPNAQKAGERILLAPDGSYEAEITVGQELLPDDYEVFFYLATGNLSSLPGPMSARLSFDVIEASR